MSGINLDRFAKDCGYNCWVDFEETFNKNRARIADIVCLAHRLGYDHADDFIDDVVR